MIPQRPDLVLGLLAVLLLLVGTAAVLLLREAAQRDLNFRVQAVLGGQQGQSAHELRSWTSVFTGLLWRIGERIRNSTRLYSQDDLSALEGMIGAAGFNPKKILPVILGLKIVLMALAPLVAYLYCSIAGIAPFTRIIILAASLPVGLLGPDAIVRMFRRPYIKALRRGITDALDLLVVCTEAGMGLESGLEDVAREMQHSNLAMANALNTLLDELRVLPDRREALLRFGKRSPVDGMRRMGAMLAQTMQYGTPLGQALRAVATDLRRERVVRLEERAVRLPALLVFPLVMFIMPSIFIVMGGVPLLHLLDMLSSMSGAAHSGG